MEHANSQHKRKRDILSEPDGDKQRKRGQSPQDAAVLERLETCESMVRNLAIIVEKQAERINELEGRNHNKSNIVIEESYSNQFCPVKDCNSQPFKQPEHLHRHIKNRQDESHQKLVRYINETYCVSCAKPHSRPCDLVRHEKAFHHEDCFSRVSKFVEQMRKFTIIRHDLKHVVIHYISAKSFAYFKRGLCRCD